MPPKNAKTGDVQMQADEPIVAAAAPVTQAVPVTPAPAEPKKERKAEHEFIDAKGDVVDDIEDGTGIRYKDKKTGEEQVYQIPGALPGPNGEAAILLPGSPALMFALFGAKTKATNWASSARQTRARDNTFVKSDVAFLTERFLEVVQGQWEAPSAGGTRGPKWDLDLLAAVIVDALKSQGATPNETALRAKLGDDANYRAGATKQPEILAEYHKRKGQPAVSIASLMV